MERNCLSNFGRRPPKGKSFQVWLKAAQWLQKRCCFKFLSIFSSGNGTERFEQFWLRTSQGTILSTLDEIHPVVMEEMSVEATVDDARWVITIAHPEHAVLR